MSEHSLYCTPEIFLLSHGIAFIFYWSHVTYIIIKLLINEESSEFIALYHPICTWWVIILFFFNFKMVSLCVKSQCRRVSFNAILGEYWLSASWPRSHHSICWLTWPHSHKSRSSCDIPCGVFMSLCWHHSPTEAWQFPPTRHQYTLCSLVSSRRRRGIIQNFFD